MILRQPDRSDRPYEHNRPVRDRHDGMVEIAAVMYAAATRPARPAGPADQTGPTRDQSVKVRDDKDGEGGVKVANGGPTETIASKPIARRSRTIATSQL